MRRWFADLLLRCWCALVPSGPSDTVAYLRARVAQLERSREAIMRQYEAEVARDADAEFAAGLVCPSDLPGGRCYDAEAGGCSRETLHECWAAHWRSTWEAD